MELPYDLSLSHHQLLFIALAFICYATNMEILFRKANRMMLYLLNY